MKFFYAALLCGVLLNLSTDAQTPAPTLPPVDDSIKISTNLIQIDVSVTDKNGKPVTDLRPEEFQIFENGKRQPLSNFTFVSAAGTTDSPTVAKSSPKPTDKTIPIPPITLKQEQVRRTYALVIDDLGLNFTSVKLVKDTLKKFIEEKVQPGDLVAIVRTGTGIGTMQSFTSDKRVLLAAIERIRWNFMGRGGIGGYEPIKPTLREELDGNQKADGGSREVAGVAEEKDFLRASSEFRDENFSIGTLGSLRYIIRGMSELPGRKSVILFSEGFSLDPSSRIMDQMRVVADLANRASVVFYTVDPRGVTNPAMAFADEDIRRVVPTRPGIGRLDTDPRDLRQTSFRESQMSLRFLAGETGGIAVQNQNNFGRGLENALNDLGSYYLLGYVPDDDAFDPKKSRFNKLEVKVSRPGVTIRYRSGFYSISDETIRQATSKAQPKIVAALTSPFEQNDIDLNLYPVFENDPALGNIVQALVHIDARNLQFTESGTKRKANFDLLAMAFGDNGNPVEQLARNYTVEVTEAVYQAMLKNGFVYTLAVPMKKSGAYQFRVAVRDTATEKVGSATQFIEVPDVTKKLVLSNLLLDKVRKPGSGADTDRSVLLDAALRKFKRNSIVRFDYVIYNPDRSTMLESQTRLIKDGKVISQDTPGPVNIAGVQDLSRIQTAGGFGIGDDLAPGNYLLQVIVFDRRDGKKKFASQFVEFEVIE